jgi:hypothetical protein
LASGRTFPNIVLDLAVLELPSDELDARFLDDRRDPTLDTGTALRHAPESWQRWVRHGRVALPPVLSSRVLSTQAQSPEAAEDRELLEWLYRFFDTRKHAFEFLASRVAVTPLSETGGRYSLPQKTF